MQEQCWTSCKGVNLAKSCRCTIKLDCLPTSLNWYLAFATKLSAFFIPCTLCGPQLSWVELEAGGRGLPRVGLPNPPKALLERLLRPPKVLERLKGSAKCQTGISDAGPEVPDHSNRLFSYKPALFLRHCYCSYSNSLRVVYFSQ